MNSTYWCFSPENLVDALQDYRKELEQQALNKLEVNMIIAHLQDFLCSQAAHDHKMVINSRGMEATRQLIEIPYKEKEQEATGEAGQ